MAELVLAIHVLSGFQSRMAGLNPAMTACACF